MKSNLKKEIEKTRKIFNQWIRKRDLLDSGRGDEIAHCFICHKTWILDTTESKRNWHASHYWRADLYQSVRFDEINVHGCCKKCNRVLHGNLAEYEARLVEVYGQEKFNDLKRRRLIPKKWTIPELKQIQEDSKKELEK